MSFLTFDTLFKSAQEVYDSKTSGTPLYLDKSGKPTKDVNNKASIVDIFYRMQEFFPLAQSQPPQWKKLVFTITCVIENEYTTIEACFLFRKLIKQVDDELTYAPVLLPKKLIRPLFSMASFTMWIGEHCMQDLFINLRKEFTNIFEEAVIAIKKLPRPLHPYFLSRCDSTRMPALKTLWDARPKTPYGEILFAKLKPEKSEQSFSIGNTLHEEQNNYSYSPSKITAFTNAAFIAELNELYPSLEDGLDEINTYCLLMSDFINTTALFNKFTNSARMLASFEDTFFDDFISSRELKAKGLPAVDLLAFDKSYSAKLARLIMNKNKLLNTEDGYSDVVYDSEFIFKPFLDLADDYESSYQAFFFDHLDQLKNAHDKEKRALLSLKSLTEYKPYFSPALSFDNRFDKIRERFLGPKFSEFIPSAEAWQKYIIDVKTHLHKAYKNPSVAECKLTHQSQKVVALLEKKPATKTLIKHLEGDLEKSKTTEEPKTARGGAGVGACATATIASSPCLAVETPKARGGAGAAWPIHSIKETRAISSAEDVSSSEVMLEAQIKKARQFFSISKKSKLVDLYEEIEKAEFDFTYSPRVLDWLESPEIALGVPPYNTMGIELQQKMVHIHAFSLKVDHFLNSRFSQKRIWKSAAKGLEEDLYVIPGYMLIKGISYKGVFEYCLSDECYHRCFKILKAEDRFSDYLDAPNFDYEKAFPSLHETTRGSGSFKTIGMEDFEVTIDPLGAAHFEDRGVSYTLLNLNS